MPVDREGDRESLVDGLRAASAGSSYVLVLMGEAGIGKTTLLDYMAETATGFRVVRAYGFESESCIGFAGITRYWPLSWTGSTRCPGLRPALSGRSSGQKAAVHPTASWSAWRVDVNL